MIKPLGSRVLVEITEAEEKTPGGIIIPDANKEKPLKGKVVAVGPSVAELKEGNEVLFGKYAGSDIAFGGKPHLIIQEADILGVLGE